MVGATPGPWKAEYDGDIERWIVRAAGEPDWRIADTAMYAEPDLTGEDNARMLAAAPDLADALEAFVAVHAEDGVCGPNSSAKAEGAPEWCGWCESARAALRSAGRLP